MPHKQEVLVVDDEPQILVALEDLLGGDFTVLTATSAEHALSLMAERPEVAVVVTDQRMPKMPGDELVSRLHERYEAQRIMVTGYADLSAVVRAVNEGQIFAYVTKPWNEEDLRLKVSKAAEQFRLSRELAEEKKLLDDLMEYSPDGIYFKDRDLRFLRLNQVSASSLGLDVHEAVGQRLRDLFHSEEAEETEKEEAATLDKGIPVLDAMRRQTTSEGTRWISERKAPVRSPSGQVIGLVGISRDVTKQFELEEQLRHAQKMEAVGRLAGGVAHDFNNLLAIIRSYGTLVRDDLPEGSSNRRDMSELLAATERARALTSQLLTFSRRRPVVAVAVDVNEAVLEIEKMIGRLVDQKVTVRTELEEGGSPIRGDANQLSQVLLNLAINARDAMPGGGELVLVTSETRMKFAEDGDESDYVCITVRDTGTGIPPEVQERIFEPFFSTKEVGKGTGLGLSTVYGIVRQWGGEIRVESRVGVGTCFKVYFPKMSDDAPTESRPRPTLAPQRGRATVLLVEDNEPVRTIAARILREAGHDVVEASMPSEARQFAESGQHFDLLLSDIRMPETSGIDLARLLRQHAPDLRVLFMSGYAEGNDEQSDEHLADAHFLEKPFSPETLAEAVRVALDE